MFSNIISNKLHHAYLVEGDAPHVIPELEKFLESIGVSIKGNQNIFRGSYESFLIDDAHDIKQRQMEKSADDGVKIFIIETQFINHHAQNALLKTLEEPTANTHFFIIMPSIRSLYDTFVSRCMVLGKNDHHVDRSEAQALLSLPLEKRLLSIADIIKAHENDENSGALRSHAIKIVSDVEFLLYEQQKKQKVFQNVLIFNTLSNARTYLNTAGASVKMILEQIAISL